MMNIEGIFAKKPTAKVETGDDTKEIANEAMSEFTSEQLDVLNKKSSTLLQTIENAQEDKLKNELASSRNAQIFFTITSVLSGLSTVGAMALKAANKMTHVSGDMQSDMENFWSKTALIALVTTFVTAIGSAMKKNDMEAVEEKLRANT